MQLLQEFRSSLARLRWLLAPRYQPRWPRLQALADFVERGVHLLDSAVPVPGTRLRVGLDPLAGLLFPALGDALGGAVSLGVLFLAVQYHVPARVIGRMVLNIAVDTAVGSVPIAGDVFDLMWKSNERNFALLKRHRGDVRAHESRMYAWSVAALLLAGLACVAAPIALVVWLVSRWWS